MVPLDGTAQLVAASARDRPGTCPARHGTGDEASQNRHIPCSETCSALADITRLKLQEVRKWSYPLLDSRLVMLPVQLLRYATLLSLMA